MHIPAVDLGIMAEHLATHEGMINKIKLYYPTVKNHALQHALSTHLQALRSHVQAMLNLVDPSTHHAIHLHQMPDVTNPLGHEPLWEHEKDIAQELKATAKLVEGNNFASALMMKNPHVKHAHIEMALQEAELQTMYHKILKTFSSEFVPMASEEMQLATLKQYYHVLHE
jgi:hypothetical protein